MFGRELKDMYNYSGVKGALTFLGYRFCNKIAYFDCLRTMTLQIKDIDPKYLNDIPEGYEARLLSLEEVLEFSKDPQYQLSAEFLENAIDNGDGCFAMLHNGKLASYGWYSSKPSKVTSEFEINFPDEWVYMHHGYTNKDHRGKRLHAIGMALALKHYSDQGYLGLVSIVASENAFSLKSVRRLGYCETGKIYLFARLGRYFVLQSSGAKRNGMWLSPMVASLKAVVVNRPKADRQKVA